MRHPRLGLAVATLGLGVAAPGRADLDHDVTRLVEGWQPYGQVLRDEPRLAERSSPTLIFTPTAAKALKRARCLTIAVIGPSSANFVVRPLGPDRMREPGADGSLASVAGLVELTRCGRDRFALGAVLVEMRSPRAVLETVLVESEKPLPRATKVVPQRDPGPVEPFTLLDLRPVPVPIAARSGSVEARLRREGGRDVASEPVKSNADGAGSLRKTLAAGCYRFELLAEPPAPGSRTELSFAPTIDGPARVVSIDSGNGLQSTTTLCAGAETQARLDFSGAPAGSALLLASARWPLPDGLPEAWGAPARAAIAATLHRYRARASGFPVDHALGIQGPTLLPARVEPGACYIAVVAAINGRPSALSLAVKTSGVSAQNHAGSEADGTLVSFCVRAGTEALLEVDSRGYALIWLYALFQTGRFELGAEPG